MGNWVPNVFTALALLLLAPAAVAMPLCTTMENTTVFYRGITPWKSALQEKRYADLDGHYNALLDDYAAGRLNDQLLNRWFEVFWVGNTAREPLHQDWIRQFPNSGAAHLAAAYYYVGRGNSARGGEYTSKTSEGQFQAMGEEYQKAYAALEKAETRIRKPSLVTAMRIWMLGNTGDPSGKRLAELYTEGLKRFPDSLQIRVHWVTMSHPKWYGSVPQLQAAASEARKLPADDRRYIEYLVTQELGSMYQMKDDKKSAAEHYEKAIKMCPGLDGALKKLVTMLRDDRNFDALLPALVTYLEYYPRSGWAYATRGWVHSQRKDWNAAAKDYEKSMNLGTAEGYEGLAWLTEWGYGVKQDYAKAIDLYETAAANGSRTAGIKADKIRKATGIKVR